jgi:hypothetical protein
MTENLKDQMVETEDLLTDCIYASVDIDGIQLINYETTIDAESFIEEFQSRGKSVQLRAVLDLVGVKTFPELEEYFKEEIQ